MITDVPVDLGADEARRLVLDELAKAEYQRAQPNWLDRVATAFLDWLQGLSFGDAGGPPGSSLLVIGIVLVVALVVIFLVFGRPRLGRRSSVAGSLFGVNDDRDAAAMRRAAAAAASGGDFTLAIEELFRAIARSLAERTVVTVTPGTTARDFSTRAGAAFPGSAPALADAAAIFDGVRYLGRTGLEQQYAQLLALDTELTASRPLLEPVSA